MANETELDDLIADATNRAVESATLSLGREPTRTEVAITLLQAQISTLAAMVLDEDTHLQFWRNVAIVGRRGRTGEAS